MRRYISSAGTAFARSTVRTMTRTGGSDLAGPDGVRAWLDQLVATGAPRGDEARNLSAALAERLGHPHRVAPAVHVVGTAGKGTVVAVLTARLVASGLRVATHQSPHVHDLRERFMIDGALPDWAAVVDAARAVAVAVDEIATDRGRSPSFFAATAALSWELGRRAGVDVFVTEAGIGGRLDATAILDRPDTLTLVTAIGLDHTDVLGSTVEAIAAEKATVFEGRADAVLGPQPDPGATRVVRDHAIASGCVLHEVGASSGDWWTDAVATADLAASILGEHLGLTVAPVPASLKVPGRHEVVHTGSRRLVLDGAHNPMKLEALHRSFGKERPALIVVALGAAKALRECGATIANFGTPVVAVEFGGPTSAGPRSWPAKDVAEAIVAAGGMAEAVDDADAAARCATRRTRPGDIVLVTGSFLHLSAVSDAFAALADAAGGRAASRRG